MNTTYTLATLAILFLLPGCKESPPAGSALGEVAEPDTAACPAGQAIVRRGEATLQVSVADAFANAQDNDQIQLGAGRAVAATSFTLSQVQGVHITGVGTTLVAKSDIPVVVIDSCEGVTLDGVHVIHEIGEWCAHACVSVSRSSKMTIMNCDLDGSGYWGVCIRDVTDSRIVNNIFHNCHDGFTVWSGGGIELRGNTFKGNRNEDITAKPGAFINDVKADNTFSFAQDLRDYLVIQGTDSPDGRYAVAWGSPEAKVDRSDPHAILQNPIQLEIWLVERETGKIMATLDSEQWHSEKIFRYFSDVSTCWRADGKAVLVVQNNRWSLGWVTAMFLDAGDEDDSRVLELTEPLLEALQNRLLLKHPGKEEGVRHLSYSVIPMSWVDNDSVRIGSGGQLPKREDPLGFEEDVILNLLPKSPFIKITDVP